MSGFRFLSALCSVLTGAAIFALPAEPARAVSIEETLTATTLPARTIPKSYEETQKEYRTVGTNTQPAAQEFSDDPNADPFGGTATAPKPAWAQKALQNVEFSKLKPFGSDLFNGNFSSTYQTDINSDYSVEPGDRITVRMWGAKQYEDSLAVDLQGNIFIPEIGPVRVGGVRLGGLLGVIKSKVAEVFTDDVEVYVNLQSSQPIAVFVTGFVNRPGRYAGSQNDNVLSYIDRAGGINPLLGSYRTVSVKRGGKVIQTVDFYRFLVQGDIPLVALKNNDVILIGKRGLTVSAFGDIRKPATYEFLPGESRGEDLLNLAAVSSEVSHVQVSGVRGGKTFNTYITMREFMNYRLNPDDRIMFVSDTQEGTILASVVGAVRGNSRYIVRKGTRLLDVLADIRVDRETADIDSVYIRRKSVAEQQKIIIDEALNRLEQSSLTAESGSVDEASIRVKEAELIQDFVKRARAAQPDGIVVVSSDGFVQDLLLEDQDEIIIPQKSDVVQIGGEVLMPKAVVWHEDYDINRYVSISGGFSQRADAENILVVLPNGQVGRIGEFPIRPGARVIVMPRVDTKNMQFAKDVMQIMYQLAVATQVVVGL